MLTELTNLILSFAVLSHLCVEAKITHANVTEAVGYRINDQVSEFTEVPEAANVSGARRENGNATFEDNVRNTIDGLQAATALINTTHGGRDVLGVLSVVVDIKATFFPVLAPFAVALRGLFALFTERNRKKFEAEVMREFRGIHARLGHVDRQLKRIQQMLEDVPVLGQTQKKRDSVQKLLWPMFMDFLAHPNNLTRREFLDGCGRHRMIDHINYMHSAIARVGDLLNVWKREYDRNLLKREFTTTTALFVHAIVLYESCIAVGK